jgi:hypothetical protein
MEHRWGERLAFVQPVTIVHNGTSTPARLVSTSVSGALVESGITLPLFANIRVILPAAPHSGRDPAELVACVMRHAPGGFAVEWRDMAAPPIVALLARRSGHDLQTLCSDPAMTGHAS